jgi:thioesterase domain-containing protein/acyl carrier protein
VSTSSSDVGEGQRGAERGGRPAAGTTSPSRDRDPAAGTTSPARDRDPAAVSPSRSPDRDPADGLERSLIEIWQRLLRVDHVGLDDDFFDLGGHSLLGIELAYEIEERLGRVCTLTMLFRNPTVRALAAELHAGGAEATEPVVLELAGGGGPTVFCICGVHVYQELAEELAPGATLYGVFLPVEQELYAGGRGGLSVEAIARRYLASVREHQPRGPYVLLGFCFGGILAYEVARQLRAGGEEVSLLVMLDSTVDSGVPSYRQRLADRVQATLRRQGDRLPVDLQRRLLGPDWVSPANQLDRMRMRIYLRAMRRYQVKPYAGRTVLVKPPKDTGLQPEAAWAWHVHVPDLEVCEVEGTHRTHLGRGNAHLVARALRPHLDAAGAPTAR